MNRKVIYANTINLRDIREKFLFDEIKNISLVNNLKCFHLLLLKSIDCTKTIKNSIVFINDENFSTFFSTEGKKNFSIFFHFYLLVKIYVQIESIFIHNFTIVFLL